MDPLERRRLQYFLSIADTVHDFGDLARYPIGEATDNLDKRQELRSRIAASLLKDIWSAAKSEMQVIVSHPDNEQAQHLLPLYDAVFEGGLNIPKSIGNEDAVCDIIKMSCAVFGRDYTNEGKDYAKIIIDREETTPECLYGKLSDLSGRRFIKYALDKNQADNALFKDTTDTKNLDKAVKAFVFKSRYKGLFDDFDCHRNKTAEDGQQNNAIRSPTDCFHKDNVGYTLCQNDGETLELTDIGVKNLRPYKIRYSHANMCDVTVVFLERQKYKGLTLFAKAVIEMADRDLKSLQDTALRVIDQVFSLRCELFRASYDAPDKKSVYLSPVRFPTALYDLKRAMDYLPVKATENANYAFAHHDMIYFYVSSDRLAIAYALLRGCPCVLVEKGGVTLHVFNQRGCAMSGGLSKGPTARTLSQAAKRQERPDESDIDHDHYLKVRLVDVLPDGEPANDFEAFLVRYAGVFEETHMTYFWYAVFRFLFFLL
jgi:hypothetical protein